MRAFAVVLGTLVLAACDPVWTVNVEVNDPGDRDVSGMSVALVCDDASRKAGPTATTDASGVATIRGVGADIPRDCDVVVSQPGTSSVTIPYETMCPDAPARCERTFHYQVKVVPCGDPATCENPRSLELI